MSRASAPREPAASAGSSISMLGGRPWQCRVLLIRQLNIGGDAVERFVKMHIPQSPRDAGEGQAPDGPQDTKVWIPEHAGNKADAQKRQDERPGARHSMGDNLEAAVRSCDLDDAGGNSAERPCGGGQHAVPKGRALKFQGRLLGALNEDAFEA